MLQVRRARNFSKARPVVVAADILAHALDECHPNHVELLDAATTLTYESLERFVYETVLDARETVVEVYGHGNLEEHTVQRAYSSARQVKLSLEYNSSTMPS